MRRQYNLVIRPKDGMEMYDGVVWAVEVFDVHEGTTLHLIPNEVPERVQQIYSSWAISDLTVTWSLAS